MIYGLYVDAFSSKQDIADAEDKHRGGSTSVYGHIFFSRPRPETRAVIGLTTHGTHEFR